MSVAASQVKSAIKSRGTNLRRSRIGTAVVRVDAQLRRCAGTAEPALPAVGRRPLCCGPEGVATEVRHPRQGPAAQRSRRARCPRTGAIGRCQRCARAWHSQPPPQCEKPHVAWSSTPWPYRPRLPRRIRFRSRIPLISATHGDHGRYLHSQRPHRVHWPSPVWTSGGNVLLAWTALGRCVQERRDDPGSGRNSYSDRSCSNALAESLPGSARKMIRCCPPECGTCSRLRCKYSSPTRG